MVRKIYNTLFLGALKKQRGDHRTIHYLRSLFWISLSTSLYCTTLLHWIFAEQYIAFSKLKGEGFFDIKGFNGSLLTIFFFIIIFVVVFIRSFPNIVVEFKELDPRRKSYFYRWFLLYHLPSFVVYVYGYMFFLGTTFWD